MKRIFTISVLFMTMINFFIVTKAQSPRLILAEEFTQASCPPCATQNPPYNNLLNGNPTKIVAIKYQTDWPGDDPMNVQTAALVQARVNYYHPDSVGVPYAVMDGVPQSGSTLSYTGAPGNLNITKLNQRAAITSPFTLAVTHTINSTVDSIFIQMDITCTQAVTGSLVAHVAIIEREVVFCEPPGNNGEEDFEGVMRDMLPNASGTSIAGSWTVGQTQTITYAAKIRNYVYDKNQLAVVGFIQDVTPCHWPTCSSVYSVLQAAYSAPQPVVTVDARLGCGSIGNPEINCGTDWTPTVIIKNFAATALTSATINYTIDGVNATPVQWTGNLVTNQTAQVALPPVISVLGDRDMTFSVTNPNGQPDVNQGWDGTSISYYDYGTTGSAPPLIEGFASTAFPPTALWRNVNPNAGAGWTRVTTGLNGTGSARMYFWGSGAGQIDELWLPSQDFSVAGTTTANIDFDLANCQYSGTTLSNDKMEIQISTDCGATWSTVFSEAGAVLANGNPPYSSASWTPSSPSQWHHKTVGLNGGVGHQSVFIKFKGTSNNGQNCFIDNLNISTNVTVGVQQIPDNADFAVYPNPTSGQINVSGLSKFENATVVVTNSLGAIVRTYELMNDAKDILTIDLSSETKGFYEISVRSNDRVITKRISVIQ